MILYDADDDVVCIIIIIISSNNFKYHHDPIHVVVKQTFSSTQTLLNKPLVL